MSVDDRTVNDRHHRFRDVARKRIESDPTAAVSLS